MGLFKRIFGSQTTEPEPESAAVQTVVEIPTPAPEPEINIDAAEREALVRLAGLAGGTSLEDFGQHMGMESVAALYRLDKLVRLGLVKRSRPMFRQPEVYELTEKGTSLLSS